MLDNRAGPRVPAVTRCLWRKKENKIAGKLEAARCNAEQSAACVYGTRSADVSRIFIQPTQKSVEEAVVATPTTIYMREECSGVPLENLNLYL